MTRNRVRASGVFVMVCLVACTVAFGDRNEPSSLESLSGVRILLLEISGNGDEEKGLYYYDADARRLHLATHLTATSSRNSSYTWLPERSIWTGEEFVYGSRVHGYFALARDNTIRQLSHDGQIGHLSRDGRRILRFVRCGPEGRNHGWSIRGLDEEPSPFVCFQRYRNSNEAWYAAQPVWNEHRARSDFVVRTQYGRTNTLRTEQTRLMRIEDDGSRRTILDLNIDFPSAVHRFVAPRPDGEGFALRLDPLLLVVIDKTGERVGSIDIRPYKAMRDRAAGSPFSRSPFHLMKWSDDSSRLAFTFETCANRSQNRCYGLSVFFSDPALSEPRHIADLPGAGFIKKMLWSPDGEYLGFSGAGLLSDGRLERDLIYTVRVEDGRVEEHSFDHFFVHEAHWIR